MFTCTEVDIYKVVFIFYQNWVRNKLTFCILSFSNNLFLVPFTRTAFTRTAQGSSGCG